MTPPPDLQIPPVSDELARLYQRDARTILSYPYQSNGERWQLSPIDVLRTHYVVVNFCIDENIGQPIGGIGPRSFDLLMSAVDRQYVQYEGHQKWSDIYHSIGTLVFGIVKNHPFYDANKRTGLLTLIYALYKAGRYYTGDKNQIENIMVSLADDSLHLIDDYESIDEDEDKVIQFLARHIDKNSRDIDKRVYTITYRELATKLKRFNYGIENPEKNYIDLIFSEGDTKQRVAKIGFPGWSRQVAKGDMRKILDSCNLVQERGIDSEVFFHEEDPISYFASDYSSQIRSLAFR